MPNLPAAKGGQARHRRAEPLMPRPTSARRHSDNQRSAWQHPYRTISNSPSPTGTFATPCLYHPSSHKTRNVSFKKKKKGSVSPRRCVGEEKDGVDASKEVVCLPMFWPFIGSSNVSHASGSAFSPSLSDASSVGCLKVWYPTHQHPKGLSSSQGKARQAAMHACTNVHTCTLKHGYKVPNMHTHLGWLHSKSNCSRRKMEGPRHRGKMEGPRHRGKMEGPRHRRKMEGGPNDGLWLDDMGYSPTGFGIKVLTSIGAYRPVAYRPSAYSPSAYSPSAYSPSAAPIATRSMCVCVRACACVCAYIRASVHTGVCT